MHTQKHVPRPITYFLFGFKIHVLCSGPVDSKLCIEPVPGIKLENCSVPECKEYWWEGPWQVLCSPLVYLTTVNGPANVKHP